MAVKFTETLELARQLLRIYLDRGEQVFLALATEQVRLIRDDRKDDPKEVNSALITLLSGILSVVYPCESEQIIRKQVTYSENFVNEPDPQKKGESFLADLKRFLTEFETQREKTALSKRVILYLSSCSLGELQNVTVTSLAEKFNYHPNYFTTKFKSEQKSTLQEAILDEKLNRAWYLLKEEKDRISIKMLSRSLGFTTPPYFSQLFKKRFGTNPGQLIRS